MLLFATLDWSPYGRESSLRPRFNQQLGGTALGPWLNGRRVKRAQHGSKLGSLGVEVVITATLDVDRQEVRFAFVFDVGQPEAVDVRNTDAVVVVELLLMPQFRQEATRGSAWLHPATASTATIRSMLEVRRKPVMRWPSWCPVVPVRRRMGPIADKVASTAVAVVRIVVRTQPPVMPGPQRVDC